MTRPRSLLLAACLLACACACACVFAGCKRSSPGRTEELVDGGAVGDLCQRTVDHLMSLMPAGAMGSDERLVVGLARASSIASCRKEGLSQAQADCILAVSTFEELMDMGSCAALRQDRPSWLTVPPTAEERRRMMERMRPPDGPRTGPVRYRQLVGSGGSTCGLREDGTLQCWGSPVRVPSGSFTAVGWGQHLCGLDRAGILSCASDTRGDDLSYLPGEPLAAFAEGRSHGCGIKRSDRTLICWSRDPEHAVTPPAGEFVEIVSGLDYTCARGGDGEVTCFGGDAPTAPDGRFVALAGGLRTVCGLREDRTAACWGAAGDGLATPPAGRLEGLSCGNAHCCAIRDDDTLACWGSGEDGRASPPEGKFSVVFAGVEHSCGVRTDGTVCWGKNHLGQGNVPQDATDHHWHRPGR